MWRTYRLRSPSTLSGSAQVVYDWCLRQGYGELARDPALRTVLIESCERAADQLNHRPLAPVEAGGLRRVVTREEIILAPPAPGEIVYPLRTPRLEPHAPRAVPDPAAQIHLGAPAPPPVVDRSVEILAGPASAGTRSFSRWVSERPHLWLWAYLLLIAMAELLTSVVSAQAGLTIHGLLLVGLLLQGALGRPGPQRDLLLALTLMPLLRLLSLSLPLALFPRLAWYPIIALPLLFAAWRVIRLLRVSRRELGVCPRGLVLQVMLVAGAPGLAVLEYRILKPEPLISSPSLESFLFAVLLLIVFTGFAEELIFRGLLQSLAVRALGRWALLFVALLFAALHIGNRSVMVVAFVAGAGLLFGYVVHWSGSIVGVSLVHGLTGAAVFLVLPYLAQQPPEVFDAMTWTIWLGAAIATASVALIGLSAHVGVIRTVLGRGGTARRWARVAAAHSQLMHH